MRPENKKSVSVGPSISSCARFRSLASPSSSLAILQIGLHFILALRPVQNSLLLMAVSACRVMHIAEKVARFIEAIVPLHHHARARVVDLVTRTRRP